MGVHRESNENLRPVRFPVDYSASLFDTNHPAYDDIVPFRRATEVDVPVDIDDNQSEESEEQDLLIVADCESSEHDEEIASESSQNTNIGNNSENLFPRSRRNGVQPISDDLLTPKKSRVEIIFVPNNSEDPFWLRGTVIRFLKAVDKWLIRFDNDEERDVAFSADSWRWGMKDKFHKPIKCSEDTRIIQPL